MGISVRMSFFPHQFPTTDSHGRPRGIVLWFSVMEEAPFSKQALARIEAARLEPAPTRTGHIEKSSLKKQHPKACTLAKVTEFPLYTFRHTCLMRWAAHMDPYTLGYLAGHSDFSTTRRYVHPQVHTVREAIERARSPHSK